MEVLKMLDNFSLVNFTVGVKRSERTFHSPMINNVDPQPTQTNHYFQEKAPFRLGLRLNAQEHSSFIPNIAHQFLFSFRIASRLGLCPPRIATLLHLFVCALFTEEAHIRGYSEHFPWFVKYVLLWLLFCYYDLRDRDVMMRTLRHD